MKSTPALALTAALLSCAPSERAGTAAARAGAGAFRIIQLADTNGDGLGDVLWSDATTHRAAVWLMDGTRLLRAGEPFSGPPGEGWSAITTGDFNRDGMHDVIWSDPDSSLLAITLLAGTRVIERGAPIHGPPGALWSIANDGDTNGDGMADAFWHSPDRNEAAVWLMDGTRVLARGPEIADPPGSGWSVANVADMNGDGLADIIWSRAPPDTIRVWLMNGTRILARGPELPGPPGAAFRAVTVGDFDGDGMNDVVWARPGRMIIWFMNGTRVRAIGPEIEGPGEDWEIANVGDANGDGQADVVWQKIDDPHFTIWLMRGGAVLARGPEIEGPT